MKWGKADKVASSFADFLYISSHTWKIRVYLPSSPTATSTRHFWFLKQKSVYAKNKVTQREDGSALAGRYHRCLCSHSVNGNPGDGVQTTVQVSQSRHLSLFSWITCAVYGLCRGQESFRYLLHMEIGARSCPGFQKMSALWQRSLYLLLVFNWTQPFADTRGSTGNEGNAKMR